MPFIKNDSRINRNGRPVGSMNKKTKELRDLIKAVHEINLNTILSQLERLSMRERLLLNRDLLPFVISRFGELDVPVSERKVNLPEWMFEEDED
jgi:hypothetical protein